MLGTALALLTGAALFPLVGIAEAEEVATPPTVQILDDGLDEPLASGTTERPVAVSVDGFDAVSTLVAVVSVPNGTGTLTVANAGSVLTLEHGYTDFVDETSIGFSGPRQAVVDALANGLHWEVPSPEYRNEVELTVSVSEHVDGVYFNPTNGHYYVPRGGTAGVNFGTARQAAARERLFGMPGYLATITSANENDFTATYVKATNVWIGASDEHEEGRWVWVTGPEAGQQVGGLHFWQGVANGYTVAGRYSSWKTGEPNNNTTCTSRNWFGSCTGWDGGEDYAATNYDGLLGRWNDFSAGNGAVKSYLVEFGGTGNESTAKQAAASKVISRYVPAEPSNGVAWAVDGAVSLDWSPPASDGGSAVTGYVVRNKATDAIVTCAEGSAASTPPCTIEGLENGASVSFTVAAENALGVGPAIQLGPVTPIAVVPPSQPVTGHAGGTPWVSVPFGFGHGAVQVPISVPLPSVSGSDDIIVKATITPSGNATVGTIGDTGGANVITNGPGQVVLSGPAPSVKAALNANVQWQSSGSLSGAMDTVLVYTAASDPVAIPVAPIEVKPTFVLPSDDAELNPDVTATVTPSNGKVGLVSAQFGVVADTDTDGRLTLTGKRNSVGAALTNGVLWTAAADSSSGVFAPKLDTVIAEGQTAFGTPETTTVPLPTIGSDVVLFDAAGTDGPNVKVTARVPENSGELITSNVGSDGSFGSDGDVTVLRGNSTRELVLSGPAPSVQAALNAAVKWQPAVAPIGDPLGYLTTISYDVEVPTIVTAIDIEDITGVPTGQITATVAVPTGGGTVAIPVSEVPFGVTVTPEGGSAATVKLTGDSVDVLGVLDGGIEWLPPATTGEFPLTIHITNGSGFSTTFGTELVAKGVPQAPASVTATQAEDVVTVTWTAPSFDGGESISGYEVVLDTVDGNDVFDAKTCAPASLNETTCSISDVAASAGPFLVEVSAINAVGTGPATTADVTPGRASAPLNVTATATAGSATVEWQRPTDDGDADDQADAITSYVVTAIPLEEGVSDKTCVWNGAPDLACTIDGLATEADHSFAYTFSVTAKNAAGSGLIGVSGAATTVAALAPSAPGSVTGTTNPGTATIVWTAPADGGAPITSYEVMTYLDGHATGDACQATAPATRCTVDGLTDGKAYTFEVEATNGVGTGPVSDPSPQLVPGMLVPKLTSHVPGTKTALPIILDHFETVNDVKVVLTLGEDGGTLAADLGGLSGVTETPNLPAGTIGFEGSLVDVTTVLEKHITWTTPPETGSFPLDVSVVEVLLDSNGGTPKQGATQITLRVVNISVPTPTPVTKTAPITVSPTGTGGTTITTPTGKVSFDFTGADSTGTEPRLEVTVTPRSDDDLRGRGITAIGDLVDVTASDLSFEQVEVCASVDAAAFEGLDRPSHRLRLLHLTDDGQEHDITSRIDLDSDPAVVCGVADSFSSFEAVVYAGDRIAGTDRYDTAAKVATELHPNGAPLVYVASGEKHPDAVVAGAAAAHVDAPLLLTAAGRVPAATLAALKALDPERIVIVGGPAAVSADVLTALRTATGASVSRLAGADRFETAAAVAKATYPDGVGQVHLATGMSFPDALAAGAAAQRDGGAVLLVGSDSLPAATAAALDALDPSRIVVVGGERAIGSSVQTSAGTHAVAVERVGGADRYATAALLAEDFDVDGDVVVATGRTFADALVATTIAGRRSAPVLLTAPDQLPTATRGAMVALEPARMVVVGGSVAIGPRTELDLIRLLPEFDLDRL